MINVRRWLLGSLLALALFGIGLPRTAPTLAASHPSAGSPTQPAISTGDRHLCVLQADGRVRCAGSGTSGQLGHGENTNSDSFVNVKNLTNAIAISAGDAHTCALSGFATVRCWGRNSQGQLGNGTNTNSNLPVTVTGLNDIIGIAAGGNANGEHACALRVAGTVVCWGFNSAGQLGNNSNTNSNVPVAVSGATGAIKVVSGGSHSCVLRVDGTVSCWGNNANGQLGDGTTTQRLVATPVINVTNAIAISAGNGHTCALLADGSMRCWGSNFSGQLGNGSIANTVSTPVTPGVSGVVSIAAGRSHTCAVLFDGTARCWGANGSGQLGNGGFSNSSVPTTVSSLSNAVQIDGGSFFTCALLADGTLRCWGDNFRGQFGNGTGDGSLTPITPPLSPAPGPIGLAIGFDHSCILMSNGTVRCWGANFQGQLGTGNTNPSLTAVPVVGLTNVVQISAGVNHTCARLANGTLRCWGGNSFGELGNGSSTDDPVPTPVTVNTGALNNARHLSVNGFHTCAVTAIGEVKCWGQNNFGQLGNGTTNPGATTLPVLVGGSLNTAVEVSVGLLHTCARLANGTARCWGFNEYGQVGDGTNSNIRTTPVTVGGGSPITTHKAITAGGFHSCALWSDGDVYCWGSDQFGELGDDTTSADSALPVKVDIIAGFKAKALAGSNTHTCAILEFGDLLACWGSNSFGQLGDGTTNDAFIPVYPSGFPLPVIPFIGLAANGSHTCVLLSNATMRCWGLNFNGQLGTGNTTNATSQRVVIGILTQVFLPLLQR